MVLPAAAENVGVVRHALAGLAEAAGMDPNRVADLKTVVTEACMNAVVHAYADEDGTGTMEVEAEREESALRVLVRDHGTGIRPRADTDRQSLRMGLPLIAALSSNFEIRGGPDQGTEVTMRVSFAPEAATPEEAPAALAEVVPGAAMSMPAEGMLAPVLSRVISLFAVRADFSVDRLSDAVLLGDAVAAQSGRHFADGTANLLVDSEGDTVTVRVGPLLDGAGDQLLEAMRIPEIGGSLERLADEMRIERDADAEHLLIEISSGRAA
jgi:serine/threonine-protein kinase RsbW